MGGRLWSGQYQAAGRRAWRPADGEVRGRRFHGGDRACAASRHNRRSFRGGSITRGSAGMISDDLADSGARKCLLVEDEPNTREWLQRALVKAFGDIEVVAVG